MDIERKPAPPAPAAQVEKGEPSMFDNVLHHASEWLGFGAASAVDQAAAFPHYQEAVPGKAVANDPEAKKRARLEGVASRLEKAQRSGLLKGADKAGIVAEMSQLSPEDAAELSKVYGESFKTEDGTSRSLYSEMTGAFDGAGKETKFVDAVLTGKKDADALGVDVSVDYLAREADALVSTDERAMNELIRANATNPERAKRLADAYQAKKGTSLSTACAAVMNDGELKEANANLAGDRTTANVAIIEQGDGERVSRMLDEVQGEPGGLGDLARAAQAQTGQHLDALVSDQISPAKQGELMNRMEATQGAIDRERNVQLSLDYQKLAEDPAKLAAARVKAEGLASRLSTALSKPHLIGNNTDVTDLLRGIEPGEMTIVMQEYANQARTLGQEVDLETDLRGKLEGKDLKVANAVMSGDKELTAVSLVEASADGVFTNVDGWQQAMGTLDSGDPVADAASRARFHALMNKHQGTSDAYARLAKSETSSYERDDLLARGQIDSDSRTAELAQVNLTRNAYGGRLNQIGEGLEDTLGDAIGETDDGRDARRKMRRATDSTTQFSNLGGSEDAQLDALASLQNDTQREKFDALMQQRVGKTATAVIDEEMLLPGKHKDAGKLLAAGKYEDGVAMRMVADLDDYNVNDREDQASRPFEQVRLTPAQRARIEQLPPEQQAAARDSETATARRSLLAKADQAAGGDGAYHKLLAQELSKNELAVADDRIAQGGASDLHRLEAAGEGVLGTSLGVDSGTIYDVLGDKTPAQMKTFAQEFERENPGKKFGDYLQSKADSRGMQRDFEILQQGNYARMSPEEQEQLATDHPRALVQRVKDLEQAARGGAVDGRSEDGNDLGNWFAGMYGNAGDRVDGRVSRVDGLLDKINANQPLTAAERQDLIDQTRYMSGDQKAFTGTKSQMVNTGAEAVGTVADVGVTAITGDQTLGSVAGGATKSKVKSTFDPGRYGTNEMYRDVVQTGTDATGNLIGGKYFSNNPLGSQIVSGVGGGVSQGLADPRDLVDGGNFVEKAGTGIIEQTTSSVVTGAMEKDLGKGLPSKLLQSTVRTGITGDYSQGGGQLITDTVKSGTIDYLRTRAADAHEAPDKPNTPPSSEPMSTLTGSPGGDPATVAADASANTATIENSARTTQRAAAVLDTLDPAARAEVERMVAGAESPAQQALFERAIAAGKVEHLDRLRVAMHGVPDDGLTSQFTGQGLVQLYDQSCVPTAAQIALAHVDPMYAFDARNQPVDVLLAGQKNPMISSGGQQTPRTDADGSTAYLETMSDPVLARALGVVDPLAAQGTSRGIEATEMSSQPLHRALESATGSTYEVVEGAGMAFKTPGDGTFETLPHARMAAAVDSDRPVMIGLNGHQRTLIGTDVSDGTLSYISIDPATGRSELIPASSLDAFAASIQSLTLPAVEAPTTAPREQPRTETDVGSDGAFTGAILPRGAAAPPPMDPVALAERRADFEAYLESGVMERTTRPARELGKPAGERDDSKAPMCGVEMWGSSTQRGEVNANGKTGPLKAPGHIGATDLADPTASSSFGVAREETRVARADEKRTLDQMGAPDGRGFVGYGQAPFEGSPPMPVSRTDGERYPSTAVDPYFQKPLGFSHVFDPRVIDPELFNTTVKSRHPLQEALSNMPGCVPLADVAQARQDGEYQLASVDADKISSQRSLGRSDDFMGDRTTDRIDPYLDPATGQPRNIASGQNCVTDLMKTLNVMGVLGPEDFQMFGGDPRGVFDAGKDPTPDDLYKHMRWVEHRKLLELAADDAKTTRSSVAPAPGVTPPSR